METSIEKIQKKADQIYNKFKSYFAYQVTENSFHCLIMLLIHYFLCAASFFNIKNDNPIFF